MAGWTAETMGGDGMRIGGSGMAMGVSSTSMDRQVLPGEGLRISLTGRGSVAIDGESARFATRHAELILYLLVLAGEAGLPRDDLISTVWSGVSPAEGRPRLRTALWQIRRAMGGHAWRVERERGVVRVSLDDATVDFGTEPPVIGSTILVGWNFTMPETLWSRIA